MLLLLLVLAVAAHAAERRRVALLVDDPVLEHAVVVALEPWNLEVVPVRQGRPTPTVPAAASEAQRIADAQHAGAVVWTTGEGADCGLWVFDVETQQLVARKVELGVLDPAAAAAVALSAKTLLRASTVAPPAERVGAAAISRPREQLRLEAIAGGQAQFGTPQSFELRLGAAIAWYPRQLRHWLGLSAGVLAGPGVSVDRPGFSGQLTDITVGLAARAKVEFARRWDFEPSLGVSLHITSLDGGIPPLGIRAHVDKLDPALDVGATLDVSLGQSVRLGLIVSVAYLFTYQRYLVNGSPVVELFPVELSTALRFTAGVL